MKRNLARWERFLRLIFGTALLAWAIAGGPFWAYLSLVIVATGAWGFCPLRWMITRES